MDELFRQRPQAQMLYLDATEHPTGRNTDYKAQKHDYSGKQKQHTAKNSVLCDEYQFIHFLGFTWRGAIPDKAMAEQELYASKNLSIYSQQVILLTSGSLKRQNSYSNLSKLENDELIKPYLQ